MVQGSNVSMGAAQLVRVFIENSIHRQLSASRRFHARCWLHRYVDDIYIMIVLVVNCNDSQSDARDYANQLFSKISACYGRHFQLKTEDEDEFIGMNVLADGLNQDVILEPKSHACILMDGSVRRFRFQNWRSNIPVRMEIGILYSQLLAVMDKCSDSSSVPTSIARILLEFGASDYPLRVLKAAVMSVMRRYPFYRDILSGFCCFYQRELVLSRMRFRNNAWKL